MGLSASKSKGTNGGRKGSVQRRKSGSQRPEVRRSSGRRPQSYSRQGVSQQPTSTLNNKTSSTRKVKCSCCNQKFNIFDSLRRLYPPRRCTRCSRDVCKKCYNNKCCHKCSTKEREDIKSLTKLEEMDRKQLVGILKELHYGTKDTELMSETSNLILTILRQCDMDENFVKDFENSVSKKTTPKVTENVIHHQHLVHDKSFTGTESDISRKTDHIIVGKNNNHKVLKSNPYENGQPRFVDMFNQQQLQELNNSKDSSFDLPPPPPIPLYTPDDSMRSTLPTPHTSRVPTPVPNESFHSLKVEDQQVELMDEHEVMEPEIELKQNEREGLATPMAINVPHQEIGESQALNVEPSVSNVEPKVVTVEASVVKVKPKVPAVVTQVAAMESNVPVVVTKSTVPVLETKVLVIESKVLGTETKISVAETKIPVAETKIPVAETKIPFTETKVPVTETKVPVTETKVPVTETKVSVTETKVPVTETKIPVVKTEIPITGSKIPVTETKIPITGSKIPVAGSNMPATETKNPVTELQVPTKETKIPVIEAKTPLLKSKIPTLETKIPSTESKIPVIESKPQLLKSKIPVMECKNLELRTGNTPAEMVSKQKEAEIIVELPLTSMTSGNSAINVVPITPINSERLQVMSASEPIISRCKSMDLASSGGSRPSSIVVEGSRGLRQMSMIEKRQTYPEPEPLRTSTPRISRAQSLRSLPSAKAIEEFDLKRLKEIMERALENVSQQELATIVTNLWLIRRKMKPTEQDVQVTQIGSLGEIATSDVIPKLSVSQIKRILGQHQVSFQDCQEKFEMVQKLTQLWNDNNLRGSRDAEEIPRGDACVICLSQRANCVFLNCCHLVTCADCSTSIKECPVCRHFIVKVLRVFKA